MRVVVVLSLLFGSVASAQSSFDLTGHVAARGVNATGPASWLEGDYGRFESTGDRHDLVAVAQVGVDWRPSRIFSVHASGVARREPDEYGGDVAGLVEAYANARFEFGLNDLQIRAGQFFLPTSRENIDPLWASPYTINFSALNTWIGQEVRPVGVDLQYRQTTGRGDVLTFGATGFQGNDTMGTLLAWRGWTSGDRLSVYGEVLPLPPLESLSDDGPFFRQRDDGTTPFTSDMDGETGYSARLRYTIPQRGSLQYTYVDNQGDRRLYGDEYTWDTRFHLFGLEIGNPDALVLALEFMKGNTIMGVFDPFVNADFDAAYILLSDKRGRNRWTARYELFGTDERDFTAGERNDEDLRAWTLTWMFDVSPSIRLATEFTQITGERADAPDPDARTFAIEARYRF